MTLRILIVDDHNLLRAGLRALLSDEPSLDIVGEAATGASALRLAEQLNPQLVLLDITMPDMSGLEVTRQLLAMEPDCRVLLLTAHEDKALLREAIRSGAAGYVLKRAGKSELVDAIHACARGELYIHPAMTRALLLDETPVDPADHPLPSELTPREIEILRLVGAGHTNRQIAEILTLSVRTVETHRANLVSKLNLHSRVDLVRYAARHGLIDTDNL